jgi:hypothetical protein
VATAIGLGRDVQPAAASARERYATVLLVAYLAELDTRDGTRSGNRADSSMTAPAYWPRRVA